MQYLTYTEKNDPLTLVKVEYSGDMDIKLIAALTFIIGKWWMDTSLSLIVDAIQGEIEYQKILDTFDKYCIILKDDVLNTLNKKIVTAEDLFS